MANRLLVSAPESNASGSACSSDVASMMPTDKLTIFSTTFDSRANEKMAAPEMLTTPATSVASRIERRVGSMKGAENGSI
ncbi:hypothetical protein GCM10009094_25360 [Massilia aurea]